MLGIGNAGYAGWCKSDAMEALRSDWIGVTDASDRVRIAHDTQMKAVVDVPFWPLGQFLQPTAHRASITGVGERVLDVLERPPGLTIPHGWTARRRAAPDASTSPARFASMAR